MRKTILSLLMLAAAVFYSRPVAAQTDSSAATSLDLGKVFLKKEFTQSITIQGEDLEQMPFTSLHEAINAWTYGYYTTGASFIYVIDGNLLNDVNAYSIQDIKEITLVQNALVQISGANRQQQLVVITTRKGGPGKQGITVAGQSFLTKREKEKNASSETMFYHQYTVSAYKNTEKIQLGASVNYLRNAVPANTEPGVIVYTPSNFDRFRINAWLNIKLNSRNEFYLQLNTTPQQADADNSRINPYMGGGATYTSRYTYDQRLSSFVPVIGLRSSFLKGFTNHFSAGYLTTKNKSQADQTITYNTTGGGNEGSSFSKSGSLLKTELVLIRDNISYNASLGNWHLEPAVNLTFRYRKSSATSNTLQQSVIPGSSLPPQISASTIKSTLEGRSYFLTPSVSLSYKNIFNLQGGIFSNLSAAQGKKIKRVFPFATTTFNVLPADQAHATSLQLFGSYAQTDYFGESNYLLEPVPVNGGLSGSPLYGLGQSPDSSYWNWQVGTRVGFWHNRVSVNYNFEQRDYTSEFLTPAPVPGTYIINYPAYRSSSHHINVNAAVLNTKKLHWRTSLTASNTKTDITFNDPFYQGLNIKDLKYWTGGWVNRFSYNRFSAGLDLLYNFTKDYTTFMQQDKIQALTVQNVYVGYQLALKGTKGLEVYAASRNLAQHSNYRYQLGGTQKYYGLGFKLNM